MSCANMDEADGIGRDHRQFLGRSESRTAGDARLAALEHIDRARAWPRRR